MRTLGSEDGLMRGMGFEAAPVDPTIESHEMEGWRARSSVGALQAGAARVASAFAAVNGPVLSADLLEAPQKDRMPEPEQR